MNNYLKNDYGETIANLLSNHKGIGYKMSTSGGATKIYSGDAKLLEDIRFKLSTPKGSMLTYPEYGCNIYLYKYHSLEQPTYDAIKEEVVRVLSTFKGIYIASVEVNGDHQNNTIKINYKIMYNNKELEDELLLDAEH